MTGLRTGQIAVTFTSQRTAQNDVGYDGQCRQAIWNGRYAISFVQVERNHAWQR